MYVSEAGKLDCRLKEVSIIVLLLAAIIFKYEASSNCSQKAQKPTRGPGNKVVVQCISFHSLIYMLFHVHSPQTIILIENFNKFTKTTYANINRGHRE